MDVYAVVVTIAVVIAVAVLVLLFEKKRATGIERDLKDSAGDDDRDGPPAD
jgi:hypothetical protein